MEYLHHECENPVVHCDLKPSNVLLDGDMVAHVNDFGLASMLLGTGSDHRISSTIGLKGSLGYIAPEYGVGGGVATKGDVYSYGILLLEMSTGKRPTDETFRGDLNRQKWASSLVQDEVTVKSDDKWEMDCLTSALKIGLTSASEAPEDRPDMKDVSVMIKRTRTMLLNKAS